ncbi:MAG: SDR family NAD(P)-dependent oxidoreductase [Elusimicrobiota bacterium]|jgi:short-subunit dehydrogenase
MGLRVLITGASSGFGRELAVQLGREGCRLALTGRRAERLRETAALAREAGASEVLELVGGVEDRAAVARHGAAVRERFGGLDWAILNAGISKSGSARERFAVSDYREVYETNVFGVLNWIEEVLPGMRAAGAGVLVGVSSLAGYRGLPHSGPYGSSKAALTAILESLRTALRGTGVDVVTVCPGFVRTELTARWKPQDMPFLMEPADAVRVMIKGIKARRTVVHFPWPFSHFVKYILRNTPDFIFDRVAAKATRRRTKD